jgi:hypothetical protein
MTIVIERTASMFAFTDTAVIHTRTDTGTRDADGNKVYEWTDVESPGWVSWPRGKSLASGGTTEYTYGGDVVITGVVAVAPAGTDVTAIDAVTLRGIRYEIEGDPADYTMSPLTGRGAGIQLNLTRAH